MRVAILLAIIVILQCCCPTPGQLTESRIRCSAPAAELTKEATVTCLLPHDLSQNKTDFTVSHNPSERQQEQDRNHHQMNHVADCMWVRGKLDCTMEAGYERDGLATHSFTLRIPHFLQKHSGQYSCQVVGYEFEICSLHPRTQPLTSGEIATTEQEKIHLPIDHLSSEGTRRTAEGEQSVTSLLIIIVSATGAGITLASVFVIVYIFYRCYHVKKSVRKTDDIQMAETGGQESQNFEDGGPGERIPTPETNNGQPTDVTTSLLSEADKTEVRQCSISIQQEQINSQCSHGQNKGLLCAFSRHLSAPDGYILVENHGKCGSNDVKLSVQEKNVCCEGCPKMRESKVTIDNDDLKLDDVSADDRMCSDEQACTKKEQVNTTGKNISYSTCLVCQEQMKALHWGHDMSGADKPAHKGHTVSEEANDSYHNDKILATVRIREDCEPTLTAAAC